MDVNSKIQSNPHKTKKKLVKLLFVNDQATMY